MQHLLQLELNEVNFGYVADYARRGHLPTLSRLIDQHGLTETESESSYRDLEPWIQWVTAHTGLTREEHGVFRLGDIVEHEDLKQIWEALEEEGVSVGAISPMNAANRCKGAKFFVPDPWTDSGVTAPDILRRLHRAIAQIVNDNAQDKITYTSLRDLAIGLVSYSQPENYWRYIQLLSQSRRQPWARAMLLDLLLADVFAAQIRRTTPQFATLFLNSAAHIQHHYLFNSSAYQGPHCNPSWYISPGLDPVLEVYQLYDRIVAQVRSRFPQHRLIIATGLHQEPYTEALHYWRLRDHAQFMAKIGVEAESVEPRMSRDFVLYCRTPAEALRAQRKLKTVIADDGIPLFEVDNRGASLFVMLVYPKAISPQLGFRVEGRPFRNFAADTTFVAIKNGEHHGTGFLIDTGTEARDAPRLRPLTELASIVRDHFSSR